MRRTLLAGALLFLAACTVRPPAPAVQRAATDVRAPFSATWDAVIDVFAERTIPIRNMERASGFIVTEQQRLGMSLVEADSMADCGTDLLGEPKFPTNVNYNVVVRGDSTASTVKVTARWVHTGDKAGDVTECSTRGVWETAFESDVKRRAEAHMAAK